MARVIVNDVSDEELQEAFAAGDLKPGLNVKVRVKVYKNNAGGLKEKLNELKSKLSWDERLDVEVQPAPLAPELHFEVNEKVKESLPNLKTKLKAPPKSKDNVTFDDFEREILFHRLAQSAVVMGTRKLRSLGIPTQRPHDYFAEMMKSDSHMQKVRQSLAAKKAGAIRAEKISQLRKLRKLGKQIQTENKLKQQEQKKKLLEEVRKYRKGARRDLDFLDAKKPAKPSVKAPARAPTRNAVGQSTRTVTKSPGRPPKSSAKRVAVNKKKEYKNEKYGFGGKKRGSKRNTRESTASLGNAARKGKAIAKKRPGRSRRVQKKSQK